MANIDRLLAEQEFETMEEMQAFLDQVVAAGEPIEVAPATDLERAQELVFDAYEVKQRRQRIRLAREALDISPDCANAYVLLAELARTIEEARDFYAQGVEAGERALGPDEFAEAEGMFWAIHETRGYMRAREGLATTLWGTGEREAAIGHLQEMLRLNPGDNQGVRYILVNWLLAENDLQRAEALIDQYGDDISATWRYSLALLSFLRHGAGRRANMALKEAMSWNPFVVIFMAGSETPPPPPDFVRLQDPTEAANYFYEGGVEAWATHEPAIEWLLDRAEAELPAIIGKFDLVG